METPKLGAVNLKCGKCDKKSNQQILSTYAQYVTFEFEEEGFIDDGDNYDWRLSLCPSCEEINLSVEDDEGGISVLWPSEGKELEGLPGEVARAYKAARAVRTVDPNAFAVLLGRVLELVCLDRKAKGNALHDKLQDLADKGEIPGRLAEMAHQLRILRNIGAHATLGELTHAEVPVVDDLCRAILEYVYTAPSRIAKVEQRIKKLKRPRK